jgi:hypothetical protein
MDIRAKLIASVYNARAMLNNPTVLTAAFITTSVALSSTPANSYYGVVLGCTEMKYACKAKSSHPERCDILYEYAISNGGKWGTSEARAKFGKSPKPSAELLCNP